MELESQEKKKNALEKNIWRKNSPKFPKLKKFMKA